jgi:hypothetical protein
MTRLLSALVLVLLLTSCNLPLSASPTTALPLPAAETLPPPPPETVVPPTTLPTLPPRPEEAILILEPGPGSRLVGSVHLAGIAAPTFEQFLGIRRLLDDGSVLVQTSTTIAVELGNRGPFAIDIPFTIAGERNAFIQVFTDSPRDGGITHLNSVGVILAESGPVNVAPASPHPEDIVITLPASGATVSGGMAHVEGIGIASFEQTLVISIQNAEGTTIATVPVIVGAPDYGMSGPFGADIPYSVTVGQPGRIVVSDPSVVFVGERHLASVEVNLAP